MFLRHLILALGTVVMSASVAGAKACTATCSQAAYRLIDHAHAISGDDFRAFKAACDSRRSTTQSGTAFSCGGPQDVWCWDQRGETLSAQGSGYSENEYQARVEAQNDCKSRLLTNADCGTYVFIGNKTIQSVVCQ